MLLLASMANLLSVLAIDNGCNPPRCVPLFGIWHHAYGTMHMAPCIWHHAYGTMQGNCSNQAATPNPGCQALSFSHNQHATTMPSAAAWNTAADHRIRPIGTRHSSNVGPTMHDHGSPADQVASLVNHPASAPASGAAWSRGSDVSSQVLERSLPLHQ
jgi:hypothetical protein